jgi:hypothetical protein
MNEEKAGAYSFLKPLQPRLNETSPSPNEIRSQINAIWQKPKNERLPCENLACKENIPFYNFAIPEIFNLGKLHATLTNEQMRKSLRCEYYKKFPEFSASNVMRKAGYPFSKSLCSVENVYEDWLKPPPSFPRNQAFPEAGLSAPFPFRIVFEAKYFEENQNAKNALVEGTYQTAYYRGLPSSAGWDYAFGCLIAYDVSSNADLKDAWESVSPKHLFWEDANIFVMIIRASENQM